MKMKMAAALVLGVAMSSTYAAEALDTDLQKLSYSIGVDLGNNIKKQGIDLDIKSMAQGIEDSMMGKPLKMTESQMKDSLVKFQKELMDKRTKQFENAAEDNKAKGAAFLKENKDKSGVVALASGLQYKIVKNATGAKPKKEDTVTVEYTGRLINGEVFDSTEKSGKPATFRLDQVIPGWTEALQLMPVGSTWEIYVPSSLAYGSRNVGGLIGPNETLIFSVHLISIDKDASAKK
ncbi:MAG: FKBP-type peptidyl-prolyl cis-trans isomerase [Legionellaceae bacterium]|nr:FKBP-type peptidyl-prolyl cis-trans isomerase [Legionellaceae bacterium]